MECSTLNYLASDLDDGWDKNAHQSHSGDLTPRDFSVVKLAARQRGFACVNSWGAIPLEQYRMPYQDSSKHATCVACLPRSRCRSAHARNRE